MTRWTCSGTLSSDVNPRGSVDTAVIDGGRRTRRKVQGARVSEAIFGCFGRLLVEAFGGRTGAVEMDEADDRPGSVEQGI